MLIQLSSATPKLDPPHMRTVTGSVYGGYCGSRSAAPMNGYKTNISVVIRDQVYASPSIGYVRPASKLVTEPGMLGRTVIVSKVPGSRIRACSAKFRPTSV